MRSPPVSPIVSGTLPGRMIISPSKRARLWRTVLWLGDREAFLRLLSLDLESLARSARKRGHVPAFRFNGSSDIPVPESVRSELDRLGIRGYGYTKSLARAMESARSDYPLTFSFTGDVDRALVARDHGSNVAMVFDTEPGDALPEFVSLGHEPVPVIDGDVSDARFLDPSDSDGRGVIVGLRFKAARDRARAVRKAIRGGWVVPADEVAI